MSVNSPEYLKELFDQQMALGDKAISSDFTVVLDGFENLMILFKQFPTPVLSSQGEIEVPGPMGTKVWQMQQVATALQGPVAMFETKRQDFRKMQRQLISKGGVIASGRVYEGTPQNNTGSYRIKNIGFVWDTLDRDVENRTQVVTPTGTVFYHFHDED